jgi:hypothetical protein
MIVNTKFHNRINSKKHHKNQQSGGDYVIESNSVFK